MHIKIGGGAGGTRRETQNIKQWVLTCSSLLKRSASHELGQPESGWRFLQSYLVPGKPLQTRTWKLEVLTLAQMVYLQVQTVWEYDSISPRYSRKLKHTNFWRRFVPKVRTTAPKIVGIWCKVLKTQTKRSISVALPNSSPIKRHMTKNGSCTLNKQWWEQVTLLRGPAQFWEVSIWKKYIVWTAYAHKRKACLFLFLLFQITYGRFCAFFGSLHRSYLSEKNKTKQKKVVFTFVGSCMINTVSKNYIKTGKTTAPSAPWRAQLVPTHRSTSVRELTCRQEEHPSIKKHRSQPRNLLPALVECWVQQQHHSDHVERAAER